jgi:hypothetical protein
LDEEEDPTPDTTSRPETTLQKLERLEMKRPAEEKKKRTEEKRPQHSTRLVPKVGGAHIPEDYGASKTAEQSIWWATKTASKINKLEAQLKEAAVPLFGEPKNLVPSIKEKIKICNWVEDLEIQKEKDLKRIEELQKANTRLRSKKGLLNLQLEKEKKNQAWKETALSRLEEANLTVKKLAKFDAPSRVRKDTIQEFLKKDDTNYTQIFNTLSKFASDIDDSLSEFSSALLPMKYVMEELSKELRNQREEIELQDLRDSDTQGKRKRRKIVESASEEEFCTPSPGKNPENSQGRPEKRKFPVKVKVEMDSGMQEAQGPDMTLNEDNRAETSSRPAPSRQTSTVPKEPVATEEGLAAKQPEEGKL